MDKARIFISYAREDIKEARSLYQRLKDAGYSPWMDKIDLLAGRKWQTAIERAIRDADFFILCLSPNSVRKRGFLQREIRAALDLWKDKLEDDIYLIPVMLEYVDHSEVPNDVREFQWVELYEEEGWDQLIRALEHGVEKQRITNRQVVEKEERKTDVVSRDKLPTLIPSSPPPPQSVPPLLTYDFNTVTLDAGGKEIGRRQGQARYFIEDLGDVKLEMVFVPGRTFSMGPSNADAAGVKKEIERSWSSASDWVKTEIPQHEVTVPPFFIGRFQVTQAQWRAVARSPIINVYRGLGPSHFSGDDNLPVEQVSWDDAQEYCARLAKKTGKAYRLPSEAEWEYSCRAGTMTPFAFGETITPEIVNYDGNYPYANASKGTHRGKTTPVGSLGVANAWRLFDMHGNVWEWCQDVWHDSYEGAPTELIASWKC